MSYSRSGGVFRSGWGKIGGETGMLKVVFFDENASFENLFEKQDANSPNCARHTPDQIRTGVAGSKVLHD